MEIEMMRKSWVISIITAGILTCAGFSSWAEDDDYDAAAVGKVLAEATVPLNQGLKAGEREGTPISAKYEIENGTLQLSVYTIKGDKFSEVVVDHKTGTIKKAEIITDGEDLGDAKQQSQAMAKAKIPLDKAVENALKENAGYSAVKVVPILAAGVAPMASITLIKGEEIKEVTEKLD
jgi:hypothetical protein